MLIKWTWLLNILNKYEVLLDGSLVTWKADPVKFKLYEGAKPV